ncbi:Wzz/FepE/Etk N-terminal domain-containing protein [Anaerocolumna aminovalerica]|uniref:Wzz/FepE/Etk N-terminal domain-containing protein n=1 Tax=Anaerocolumna aminovalerica TaxID=1527 RepID=UPI00248BAD5F|nr:Wzz/FepE/Etk N-terminal domain-containing protein [Anaerocolumna aminovalerica]
MNESQNNIQQYEDGIDLRELIMVLWKQKIMIISVTLIIAILAALFSKFIISPVYKTNLNIVISMPEIYITRYGEYKLPISTNGEYVNLIKSNDVVVNTIKDMEYDINVVSVQDLKDRITIGEINTNANTVQNSFTVTVSADNPEESLKLAQHLYRNYIDFMDIMMKARAVSYYYNDFTVQIESIENQLIKTREVLAKDEELLAKTPETINQKAAAAELKNDTTSYVVLENIINPNYTTLEASIIENKQKMFDLESSIEMYKGYLEELEVEQVALDKYYQSGKTGKNEANLMDVVEVSIYQPSEPVAPTHKSSPSTLMNTIIGGVLGGIISVLVVLFKAYWKKEI